MYKFSFKCILNTFRKYLHLHLRFSDGKYWHLHLKKDSNTFQIHFANTIYSASESICYFFFLFAKYIIEVILLLLLMLCIGELNLI